MLTYWNAAACLFGRDNFPSPKATAATRDWGSEPNGAGAGIQMRRRAQSWRRWRVTHLQSRTHNSFKSGPALRLPPALPPLSTTPCAPIRWALRQSRMNESLQWQTITSRILPGCHDGRGGQSKGGQSATVAAARKLACDKCRNGQPLPLRAHASNELKFEFSSWGGAHSG